MYSILILCLSVGLSSQVQFSTTSEYNGQSVDENDIFITWAYGLPSLDVKITVSPVPKFTYVTTLAISRNGSTLGSCNIGIRIDFCKVSSTCSLSIICSDPRLGPLVVTITLPKLDYNLQDAVLTYESSGADFNFPSKIIQPQACNFAFFSNATANNQSSCEYNVSVPFSCQCPSSKTFDATWEAVGSWNITTTPCTERCNASAVYFGVPNSDQTLLCGISEFNCSSVYSCPIKPFELECNNGTWSSLVTPCAKACNASEVTFGLPINNSPMCGMQPFLCHPSLVCTRTQFNLECFPNGSWSFPENTHCVKGCGSGDGDGLSPGAIAGIVIAVIIVVILAVVGVGIAIGKISLPWSGGDRTVIANITNKSAETAEGDPGSTKMDERMGMLSESSPL